MVRSKGKKRTTKISDLMSNKHKLLYFILKFFSENTSFFNLTIKKKLLALVQDDRLHVFNTFLSQEITEGIKNILEDR